MDSVDRLETCAADKHDQIGVSEAFAIFHVRNEMKSQSDPEKGVR